MIDTRLGLALAIITIGGAATAIGCGKDAREAPTVAIPADHVTAVNAAIPADLTGKVEFELGTIASEKGSKETFRLVRPKGWKAGFMPGAIEPADADHFGSATLGKTSMRVDSNCDGKCEKKDWAKVSDEVTFAQFASGKVEGKVLKDEKRPTGRTMVFEHKVSEHFPEKDVAVRIMTAWWDPDGARYFNCTAELGTPVKGLADAFEKACSKVSGE